MRLPVSFLWIAADNGIIAGLHRGPQFLFPSKIQLPKLNSTFSNPLTGDYGKSHRGDSTSNNSGKKFPVHDQERKC
jgi:hypothetical protein